MTDFILRAVDEITINAAFQALGAWHEATENAPAGPITQGRTADGQQWFIVLWGGLSVPTRSPAGWTATSTTDAMGQPITNWTANGVIVTAADGMGNQVPVMPPYDAKFYCVLRWLGDNPPTWPAGIEQIDPSGLDPDVRVALPQIA